MKFYHNDIVLDVPDSVYYPREDSLLLAKTLESTDMKGKKVLDVGCGSGFLSIVAAKKEADITAADISGDAVAATKKSAEKNNAVLACLKSDLFSNITSAFDLIIFNPPYLPEGDDEKYLKKEKNQLTGGITGREAIEKFVGQAKKHLNKNGKILLLVSSLTGEKEVIGLFNENGFKTRIIAREKIPWEELLVIEAAKL